jgi:DedD protein
MRAAFEEEEEELAPPRTQADRELTLSSTTLLVIFFGLVLICGLFFGLGYTLGRRATSDAGDAIQVSVPSAANSQLQPSAVQSKPSPASPTTAAEPPVDIPPDDASTGAQATGSQPSPTNSPNPVAQASQPVSEPAKAVVKTADAASPGQVKPTAPPATAPAPSAGIMVQIAAVSNPADADVLIGALRKRGYSVTVRNQPGDALLHVQVGPFSTRADAIAMRQKLLNDGYNAILK